MQVGNKIKITNGRILIKPDEVETKTASGIILTTEPERATSGVVMSKATGVIEVEVGDRIEFSQYAGTDLKVDGEEFIVMRPDDGYFIYPKP